MGSPQTPGLAEPHAYAPDLMAQGDCLTCGHGYESPLHHESCASCDGEPAVTKIGSEFCRTCDGRGTWPRGT